MQATQPSSRGSPRSSITYATPHAVGLLKGREFQYRLEKSLFRKPTPDIATAISPSHAYIATASHDKVRLYNVPTLGSETWKRERHTIRTDPKWGKIRAVALSSDYLAVVTFTHLAVWEYAVHGVADNVLIDTKLINPSEVWTPQSIAIYQNDFVRPGECPYFWIAIGGQGQQGVRVFMYTHNSGYGSQGRRLTLSCPNNASTLR